MRRAALACAALLLAGCGAELPRLAPLPPQAVVLAFGDSLTAGTGAEPGEDYPARLAALTGLTVVNAGVPGEVTAAGRARLPAVLAKVQPALVLLCHGGNDLLRRLDAGTTERNLAAMVAGARGASAQVVLIAVPFPGLRLKAAAMYAALGARLEVPVETEALAQILADPALKADPIHPNAAGYARLAQALAALLRAAGALTS